MAVSCFGEKLYTWYYVLVCMSCYAVGEIGHFIIGIVSKPLAQDIGFGDEGCLTKANLSFSNESILEQCLMDPNKNNYNNCISLQYNNESYCEWNYVGSGIAYQLLAGPCFIAIFTVMGIVIGVLGDSYNRVRILSVCVSFYALMALLTGFATEYWQLVMLRFGFGAGEAACTPLTASIVADKFGDQSRALGMSVFNWGIYIGYGLAFTIGNYVPQSTLFGMSWRWAYYLISIPGFLFAIVLFTTVKEPKRKLILATHKKETPAESSSDENKTEKSPTEEPLIAVKPQEKEKKTRATLWIAIKFFASSPPLLVLLLAASIRHTASFCWAYNTQLYFDYYYPNTELGIYMMLCSIVGGLIGIASGGIISDRIVSRHGVSARLWVLVVSQSIAAPLAALVLYLPPPYCFIALLSAYIFAEMWFGILFTVLVESLHPQIRSTGIGMFIFVMNNAASLFQLLVPVLRTLVGFRTSLYITYAGFYGITEMWYGVAMTVVVEGVPPHVRSTSVALASFVISNIGGNLPVVVAPLKHAMGGLRNALYLMYSGFYLLSAVFFLFAQLLMRRENNRQKLIQNKSDPINASKNA